MEAGSNPLERNRGPGLHSDICTPCIQYYTPVYVRTYAQKMQPTSQQSRIDNYSATYMEYSNAGVHKADS